MEITELYDLDKMIASLKKDINDPTIEWEDRGELAFNIQLCDWLEELRDLRSKAVRDREFGIVQSRLLAALGGNV